MPLAVLSGAWTVELCQGQQGTTPTPVPSSVTLSAVSGPDGSGVPATGAVPPTYQPPVQIPATPLTSAPALGGSAAPVTAAETTSTIPSVALAAYQRAATVMNTADASCHLPWQLLAAIGDVESGNGQAHGNHLTSQGIATPGIFGPVLNGKDGTTLVKDTDGGALDGNKNYDRAVGPMQFIPSTWSMVAVDADGDGKRNPQDINDASLAAAAYLCAGKSDLANAAGQRQAVFRYNHSSQYVRLVLAVEAAYKTSGTLLDGSPGSTLPAVVLVPQDGAHQGRPKATPAAHTSGKKRPAASPSSPTDGKPATTTQLRRLSTRWIKKDYPNATAAARKTAVKKAVRMLKGDTYAEAKADLHAVLKKLGKEIDGLKATSSSSSSPSSPTSSPTPSPSPSSPTTSPTSSPTDPTTSPTDPTTSPTDPSSSPPTSASPDPTSSPTGSSSDPSGSGTDSSGSSTSPSPSAPTSASPTPSPTDNASTISGGS